jgi:putative glutamine amidotransferase
MRPVIGVTAYTTTATWGPWRDLTTTLIPHDYVQGVTAAGARTVLLPADDLDADVLDRLDGLLLAGGPDVDPALYGEAPGPWTEPDPNRDAGELLLLRTALARDVPVLGVCRGMQLMAVAAGGRLHQHLPDVLGHDKHRPAPGLYGAHTVRCAPGSRIAGLLGDDAEVSAYHHQGVADPGTLTATAWADDGLVEAVEDPARRFVLGVQWHPETAADRRILAALVAAC